MKKECLYCNKEFKTKNKRKKYCSANCCSYFNRKEKEKRCKNCDLPFVTKNENRVHCSDNCKSYYRRNILFIEDENIFQGGFDNVNSYIFGLIMSDGCLSYDAHSKRYRITFSSNDLHILKYIKEYCGIARNINTNGGGYSLVYINQRAIDFLSNYGLQERKSRISGLPKLEDNLMSHFIRGYFDGDGSITTNNKSKHGVYQQVRFATGSKLFADELNLLFTNIGFNSGVYSDRGSYSVVISKTSHISKFYRYIYRDDGKWNFPRKKSKFIYK